MSSQLLNITELLHTKSVVLGNIEFFTVFKQLQPSKFYNTYKMIETNISN